MHRRKLYCAAFDSLARWAWQQFHIGVERVLWEEASDLHRSSLLAWQADFTDNSYRHLLDAYPDLYTTLSLLVAAISKVHLFNGHRPQLMARQDRTAHLFSNPAPRQVRRRRQRCVLFRLQPQAQRQLHRHPGRQTRLQLQRHHTRHRAHHHGCHSKVKQGRYGIWGRSTSRRRSPIKKAAPPNAIYNHRLRKTRGTRLHRRINCR